MVRTLTTVVGELKAMGHVVDVIGPDRFRTVPCPTYPDIALSILPRRTLVRMIRDFEPDAVHIATEGPLGLAARRWALRTGFRHATGQIVIVQDADLEYDPGQYPQLIQPIIEGKADVVYGSRFIGETHEKRIGECMGCPRADPPRDLLFQTGTKPVA